MGSNLKIATFLKENVVQIGRQQQMELIYQHNADCLQTSVFNDSYNESDSRCAQVWDGVMCWAESLPGISHQECPNYINGFNISGFASRLCGENGEWFVYQEKNSSWTNFTGCFPTNRPVLLSTMKLHDVIQENIPKMHTIMNVGYGLTLCSLLAAVVIMCYFRRLRCPRTTLHLHLFTSFILRASITLLKENIFVGGVGLKSDVSKDDSGTVIFIEGDTHWQCKLLLSMSIYCITSNCMWVFVEGLYLHVLVSMAVFTEKTSIKPYILLGWGLPLLFVVPWVVVRVTRDDVMCWNTSSKPEFLWIVRAPITLAMVVNFIFFVNILRVLFTKLAASNSQQSRRYRYRKLAKSTMVLIPLFGVHYIVFIWIEPSQVSAHIQVAWLYFEMTFNSFQGFFIALLFCFLNEEVQTEIKKSWMRYKLHRMSWQSSTHRLNIQSNTASSISHPKVRTCNPKPLTSGRESDPLCSISKNIEEPRCASLIGQKSNQEISELFG
ncbi:hypothetical protein CAPTEDRAFT_203438 [Capitella teleta]|uniref:G-protein coupled receptors family 2 profile 2 domain-containing protein n=1 Tax=Capitella teleta TaxID=283909 RepID=R7VAC2_CAPTE|nr:hypothetical protein CAPTEDRAFT_203438 [Capitella teleta]|eukprot:ELU15487.1 hypothetical protein CAPTEDRAFT_203438 [Capitella teleta]